MSIKKGSLLAFTPNPYCSSLKLCDSKEGECLPTAGGVLPFRGARGVSDGKRHFFCEMTLIPKRYYLHKLPNINKIKLILYY